jgi:hypothetical protein
LSYAVADALSDGGIGDIKAFLDRVIVNMGNLVPYQKPGIRASFNYSWPVLVQRSVPTIGFCEVTNDSKGTYVAITIAIIVLLTVVLWRLKKK